MSLTREKSPTVSGEMPVGTLIGMGIWLYTTLDSNSCVSRGVVYFGACGVELGAECGIGRVGLVGESGEEIELDRDSSAMRCCIIRSNFSTKRSLVSLACKMWRSRVESRGIKDKSMELTASNNDANVSGKGDLKYSSRASNKSGYTTVSN